MSRESASGIVFLDHTADVGLAVTAPTLPELLIRTARGMILLIHGRERDAEPVTGRSGGVPSDAPNRGGGARDPPGPARRTERRMSLRAEDPPGLLRAWLRELLHWHESEGVSFEDARFPVVAESRLDAIVTVTFDEQEPVREIKGVTLHGLLAEPRGEAWVGQVIFDV